MRIILLNYAPYYYQHYKALKTHSNCTNIRWITNITDAHCTNSLYNNQYISQKLTSFITYSIFHSIGKMAMISSVPAVIEPPYFQKLSQAWLELNFKGKKYSSWTGFKFLYPKKLKLDSFHKTKARRTLGKHLLLQENNNCQAQPKFHLQMGWV